MPTLADSYETNARHRAEYDRENNARGALSDWMLSGAGRSPVQSALAVPGRSDPVSLQASGEADAPVAPMAKPDAGGGQEGADWEHYVRADPSGAMKSMLTKQNLTKAQNEAMFSQMDMMARLARSAVDQPTYEAAKARAQSLGIDTSSLPAEFDPAAVNAVELQALSAKEHLTDQRSERRAEWDVQDDQIDNARDDRNLDSQVATRQGQLANTRRGQDLSDERGRRGQDLSDSRGRRGQDLSDTRGRRGQDLRGRKPAGKAASGDGAVIVNPKTGQRMKLQGGKWVPA